MDSNIKISVVTVCYNAVDTIEDTILSVINQTYDNIEYIIIDGGSTDGTVDVIKRYSAKIEYWVSEPDKGIYDAMNKGVLRAHGKYVNFMNAGDGFYSSQVLSDIIHYFDDEVDVIYGDILLKTVLGDRKISPRPLSDIKKRDPIFHQASFIKTENLIDMPYNNYYRIAGDYDFFYKLYNKNKTFRYIAHLISYFNSGGISSTNIKLRLIENYQVRNKKVYLVQYLNIYYQILRGMIRDLIVKCSPELAKNIKSIIIKMKSSI